MAEGVKIRQLDPTTIIDNNDAFIIDRLSQVDNTVSVTQYVTYDDMLNKLSVDIGGGGGVFDPSEGIDYLSFKTSAVPILIDVTVGTKTPSHRYYNYIDSDGLQASTKTFLFDTVEAPFLILVPGNVYRFDVSDLSNSPYELRFYSNPQGAAGTGGIQSDIKSPVVTRFGTPGTPGAYVELNLEENTDSRIFYLDDQNMYMGNQIFDPGADTTFSGPDFGGNLPIFPLTTIQYNNIINDISTQQTETSAIQQSIGDLKTEVDYIEANLDTSNGRIDLNYTLVKDVQEDYKSKIDIARADYIDRDDEIKLTLQSIQSRLDDIENQLGKVIQTEDQ